MTGIHLAPQVCRPTSSPERLPQKEKALTTKSQDTTNKRFTCPHGRFVVHNQAESWVFRGTLGNNCGRLLPLPRALTLWTLRGGLAQKGKQLQTKCIFFIRIR